jgi:hypothetical protein
MNNKIDAIPHSSEFIDMETIAEKYKYIVKKGNYYINTITGESSIWHPAAIEIGGYAYKKAYKWCHDAASARNKRSKEEK